MIKIGSFFRKSIIERLKKDIQKCESLFVVQYSQLSSPDMTALRSSLKKAQSRLIVTKNTLVRRALKGAEVTGLDPQLDGQVALVFGEKDIAATSKVLAKFAKGNQNLVLKGAWYNNRLLNSKDIENISNLPSKEILRAQVAGVLQAPLAGLVFTLKGSLNKLVIVLNQIKEKK